jgi:hypothetical protein
VPRQFTIGWLRESELKHGRIAMFGFIGYIVHENGIRSPDGIANLVSTDLSAPAVWDAIPEIGKWQIVLFVGLMDIWRESKVGSSLHPPPSPPAPFAVPASFEPLRVSSPVPSSPVPSSPVPSSPVPSSPVPSPRRAHTLLLLQVPLAGDGQTHCTASLSCASGPSDTLPEPCLSRRRRHC